MSESPGQIPLEQFARHPRDWRQNLYVYPVISRRSRGLSIGVNLNPDMACNFDCVYCQVDRTVVPKVRQVDLGVLRGELKHMLDEALSGGLFQDRAFADVPPALRRINDIAFSGDGEPTTCKQFKDAVALAAELKASAGLADAKIVLITDACYLTRPAVAEALAIMDANNGEIWAKLDAGTESYYQEINRPNYPLSHVMENIIDAARARPVVIQSLFMRVHGQPPSGNEIAAYVGRLKEILQAGGRISYVQVYTVARRPAEDFVAPLTRREVDTIAEQVRARTGLVAEPYYSPGD